MKSALAFGLFPKRGKFLFVNGLNNTAGLSLALGLSLGHMDIYCMSSFNEEALLSNITKYKVRGITAFN